jgi:hypothetical protein
MATRRNTYFNHYPTDAPVFVLRTKVKERVMFLIKKRKTDTLSGGKTTMKVFHDSTKLPENRKFELIMF